MRNKADEKRNAKTHLNTALDQSVVVRKPSALTTTKDKQSTLKFI